MNGNDNGDIERTNNNLGQIQLGSFVSYPQITQYDSVFTPFLLL